MRLRLLGLAGLVAAVSCVQAPKRAEVTIREPELPSGAKRVELGDLMRKVRGYRPAENGVFTSSGVILHTKLDKSGKITLEQAGVPALGGKLPHPFELSTLAIRRGAVKAADPKAPMLREDRS